MVNVKKDFPIFNRKFNGKKLVYLDSAATSQKPKSVIDTIKDFYENHNSNIHRGIYKLSVEATKMYEDAHQKVSKFINADFEEVVFTKNTTESINLVAYSWCLKNLNKDDEILLTEMEHHSNLVPWQQIAKIKKAKLKFIGLENGRLKMEQFNEMLNKKTKVVAVTHVSNVLGTINPVKEISKIAHDNNSIVLIDAAQSVPHMKVDVKKINADFLAFSAHKMLGPTGIGVLYGKKELLEKIDPFLFGGDMIRRVDFHNTVFNELPWKFEAGTPNIAGAVGYGAAIDYLNKIGMENIEEHEKKLTEYAYEQLNNLNNLEIYSTKDTGIISFNIKKIHAHDIATLMDDEAIAIRGGHHCAMPLMKILGVAGTVRVSPYIYNTKEDIDKLIRTLKKVEEVFK